MIQLEFPHPSHKQAYLDMVEEWGSVEDLHKMSPGRLFAGNSYEELMAIVTEDITNNSQGVNSHLFFLVEDGKILGAIQVRHTIDHPNLREVGGHIGYGIRPSARGKGYATQMLRLALFEAKKFGLEKVLITCLEDNIASAKVIENNGGVFERSATRDGEKFRRYWIML